MKEADCQEVSAKAAAYVANMMQVHEKLRVARHLSGCRECAAIIDALRNVGGGYDE